MTIRVVVREPTRVRLKLRKLEDIYPHEIRLGLSAYYNKVEFEMNSKSEVYTDNFYVLNSSGYMRIENPTRHKIVNIAIELTECRIGGSRPLNLEVYSKPISKNEIHEIDEELRPDDLKISWNVDAYGFLEDKYARQYNVGLISILIVSDFQHDISRTNFVKNIVEEADMLRREFIEVIVEPINLSYVKDDKAKGALQLLSEKQKLLLGAKNKLTEAKTATDFRGIIDEVRRTVEGLELKEPYEEIYRKLSIESSDAEAIDEASEEMVEAVNMGLTATYKYASRFGIHTKTWKSGRLYTPIPTITEAEFAVQEALVKLNYLIRLLNTYAIRT
ncbi:MAG: hypothetical protein H3Z53_01935 [archaeon]|nr:hypothetical protein [archaeon]